MCCLTIQGVPLFNYWVTTQRRIFKNIVEIVGCLFSRAQPGGKEVLDIYTHIQQCIYMCTYICMYMHMYMHIRICVYVYVYVHVHVCVHVRMYAYKHVLKNEPRARESHYQAEQVREDEAKTQRAQTCHSPCQTSRREGEICIGVFRPSPAGSPLHLLGQGVTQRHQTERACDGSVAVAPAALARLPLQ
jgi:hypothetical protein